MKLNSDCIRDVLLYLEDNLGYTDNQISMEHKQFTVSDLAKELTSYPEDDIQYTVEKLYEADFIRLVNIKFDARKYIVSAYIDDITWNGHNFLNNIRPKSVWDATKAGASKLGLMSIHALSTISMKIVEKVVTDQTVIDKIVLAFTQG